VANEPHAALLRTAVFWILGGTVFEDIRKGLFLAAFALGFGVFIAVVLVVGLGVSHKVDNGYRPAKEWHFAAGTTASGLRTSLNILNPGGDEAEARVTYLLSAGGSVTKEVTVPERSGRLVDCMTDLGGRECEFGISVSSQRPVVVSREIFEVKPGYAISSVEQGIRGASSTWYFAEGSTSEARRTVLYVLNDSPTKAAVTVSGFTNDGGRNQSSVSLEPASLYVLDAASIFPETDIVSFAISSDTPVFAERYYETAYEGLQVGCCGPGSRALIGTGRVIMPADAREGRIDILNPSGVGVSVDLEYHLQGGKTRHEGPIDIDAYSRKAVSLRDEDLSTGEDDTERSGIWVAVSVRQGGSVAIESTAFGSSAECWAWMSVGSGERRADSGPVYLPVVSDPCYQEYVLVANEGRGMAVAAMLGQSTDGKSKSEKNVGLAAGDSRSMYCTGGGSRLSWYEAHVPDSGDVSWRLVSHRAFNCASVDKASAALALGQSTVSGVQTVSNKVALSFDLENDPLTATSILDALKKSGVKCAFFVSSQFASEHPDIVRRAAGAGHELGSLVPRAGSTQQVLSQLGTTEALVNKLAGSSTRPYVRLPYGSGSDTIAAARAAGYVNISWDVDPGDWAAISPDAMVANTMKDLKPGSIVLLYGINAAQKRLAIPALIDAIRVKGFDVVPLTELLYLR